jgi:hypothetical protein
MRRVIESDTVPLIASNIYNLTLGLPPKSAVTGLFLNHIENIRLRHFFSVLKGLAYHAEITSSNYTY